MTEGEIVGGHFRLGNKLGGGGFAEVWRARDLDLERDVAIKILYGHLAEDAEFVRRFRDEARRIARLRHPNIVQIHGVSESSDGRPCLIMELVAGRPLAKVLEERGRMAVAEALAALDQLAGAVDYLHSQGFVHRDLKPANVMLDETGNVTLLDFGIARDVNASGLTRVGETFGTLAYMSPEQILGERAGEASDIYGLGVVAYELLSGHPPYRGNTEAVRAAILAQPPPLDELDADLPEQARAAIGSALAKAPEERPRTAAAFVEALRAGARDDVTAELERGPLRVTEALPGAGKAAAWLDGRRGKIVAGCTALLALLLAGVALAGSIPNWLRPANSSSSQGVVSATAIQPRSPGEVRAPGLPVQPPSTPVSGAGVARVTTPSPPAVPRQTTPVDGARGTATQTVTWTAVPGSSFYCLQFQRWVPQTRTWQEAGGSGAGEQRVPAESAGYTGPAGGWVAWRVWAVSSIDGRQSAGAASAWRLFWAAPEATGPRPPADPNINREPC